MRIRSGRLGWGILLILAGAIPLAGSFTVCVLLIVTSML